MPSFPSYYLNNLDRKRERSRQLREGLQSGMAGAFEGVDRLAQLQMVLAGKAAADEEAKTRATTEAERWKAEHELNLRREDRLDRDRVGAATPEAETEAPAEDGPGEPSDIMSKIRASLERGGASEPGDLSVSDVGGFEPILGEAPNAADMLRARESASAVLAAPTPSAPRPVAGKGASGGVAPAGELSKKEIDRQRAELELEEARKRAADPDRALREKKQAQVQEVEGFVVNIQDAIDQLRSQIEKTGTFELFGPESANMERAITSIATDLAKLKDPGSVAREGEVALMKAGMFPTGWKALGTRNETAKRILDSLEAEIEQRRRRAYDVRGLPLEQAAQAAPPVPAAAPTAKPAAPVVSPPKAAPAAKPAPVGPSAATTDDPQAFFLSEIGRVSSEHPDWPKEQILAAVKASMRERGLTR